jgi:transcriptional regulator with XRE-family HTH domain
MTILLARPKETKMGSEARRLRLSLHLNRSQVAVLAGVFEQTVNLFEHDLPVALDYRRRILKALWALKYKK